MRKLRGFFQGALATPFFLLFWFFLLVMIVLDKLSRGMKGLVEIIKIHMYLPNIRMARWVLGRPTYKFTDTLYLGISPRNDAERAILSDWAREHNRVVFYAENGRALILVPPDECDCPEHIVPVAKDEEEDEENENDDRFDGAA